MLSRRRTAARIRRGIPVVSALLMILAAGCAPRGPQLPPTEPGAEGAKTLIGLLTNRACPATLTADLEIVVAPVDRPRVLLTGSLRAAWPDRVRIQARVGAFVPIVSVAVDGDSTFLSLPREKAYWRGTESRFGNGGFTGVASSLLWLLCPRPMLRALENPVLDQTPNGWTLRGHLGGTNPPVSAEIRLPRDRSRVAEIILRDQAGGIRLRSWRTGDRVVSGASIPRSVRIQSGEKGEWAEVKILRPRPDLEQTAGVFRLRPGPGVRILDDDDLILFLRELGGAR
jgi:hypothetical protein